MLDFILQILFDPVVGEIVLSIVGVLLINIIAHFLQRRVGDLVTNIERRYRIRKFITYFSYVAMVVFVAIVLSRRLGNLTVAFGVAGAGIAFALQEVIASVAGWVAISFGNFYNIGDRVQLGGIVGDVIDIGILRTTLMEVGRWVTGDLYSGRIVRIANSFVFREPVFNYSGEFNFLWDEVRLPVRHGSDHRLARQILYDVVHEVLDDYVPAAEEQWERMLRRYPIEAARIEPMVLLVVNDNWLEFTARYVVDYKHRRVVQDQIFDRVLDAFAQTEGRVSIASATLQLVGMPPVEVRTPTDRGGQAAGAAGVSGQTGRPTVPPSPPLPR